MCVRPDKTLRPDFHVARECLRPGVLESASETGREDAAAGKCRVTEVVEFHDPVPSPEHGPGHRVYELIAGAETHELGPMTPAHWGELMQPAAVHEDVFAVLGDVAIAGRWTGTQASVDARVEVYPRAENDAAWRGLVTPAGAQVHRRASGGAPVYSRSTSQTPRCIAGPRTRRDTARGEGRDRDSQTAEASRRHPEIRS